MFWFLQAPKNENISSFVSINPLFILNWDIYGVEVISINYWTEVDFYYLPDTDEQSHEDWEKNLADGIKVFKDKVLNYVER